MNYTGVYAINKYIFLWHEDVILTIYVHYCMIHVHDRRQYYMMYAYYYFHHHNIYFLMDHSGRCQDAHQAHNRWKKVDLNCQPPILIRKHLLSSL